MKSISKQESGLDGFSGEMSMNFGELYMFIYTNLPNINIHRRGNMGCTGRYGRNL